jgi:hypothetical protein
VGVNTELERRFMSVQNEHQARIRKPTTFGRITARILIAERKPPPGSDWRERLLICRL